MFPNSPSLQRRCMISSVKKKNKQPFPHRSHSIDLVTRVMSPCIICQLVMTAVGIIKSRVPLVIRPLGGNRM